MLEVFNLHYPSGMLSSFSLNASIHDRFFFFSKEIGFSHWQMCKENNARPAAAGAFFFLFFNN